MAKSPKVKPIPPSMAIAGPGAGKTFSMVEQILAALPSLPPHKFIAAITFTNSAANTIRERLQKRSQIPGNLFVGTNHQFISRFVLGPYATLFEQLPEHRIFAAIDVASKGTGAARYAENLIKKGIVPFSEMFPVARTLLENPLVRELVSQRIGHLFIDEFQDTDIGMLEIFERIRKAGKTRVFAVGDPEQFVMSFTYIGKRRPDFDDLPFFRLKKLTDSPKPLVENHRSNCEIVAFNNRFRTDIQQVSKGEARNEPRVVFIPVPNKRDIVIAFQTCTKDVEFKDKALTRLYLSEIGDTFDDLMKEFDLKKATSSGRKARSLLGEMIDVISLALDRSAGRICSDCGKSKLQLRFAATQIMRKMARQDFGVDDFVAFIENYFGQQVSKSRREVISDALEEFVAHWHADHIDVPAHRCSSIRKAKGLEADAVLALALNKASLKRWLNIDSAKRASDKSDSCRLGYVAFTRPREMLCLACLEALDTPLNKSLQGLGITILGGPPPTATPQKAQTRTGSSQRTLFE